MAAAGLVAAVQLGVAVIENPHPVPADANALNCVVYPRLEVYPDGGGRPAKAFFGPGETAPWADFGRVLGTGHVVVHYSPTLPANQVESLRALVTDGSGRVVAGAEAGLPVPVKAVDSYDTLTCGEFDVSAVRGFAESWFRDPRSALPE